MKVELAGHYGYSRIIRTMIPMVMGVLITSLYTVVDGFFISNFAGETAFAAMNIMWPMFAILGAFGMMIGTGGSALVSKTFGEGDSAHANRIFSMLVRVAGYLGCALMVVCFLFMPSIAVFLGAEGELIPYAVLYGHILILALPAFIFQMAFQSFYMTAERPQMAFWMSIISGVINIAFDAIFMLIFDMGLAGAALGTALSICIAGYVPLYFFSSRHNGTQLRIVPATFEWNSIFKACTNGLSEFVGNIAFNIVSIGYNLQLMRYIGPDGVSAFGIIMYISYIFAAFIIGYNLGITQVIAYNYGAQNHDELKSLLRKSVVILGVLGVMLTTLALISAPLWTRCFVGYNPALCELTVHGMRLYVLNFLICGISMFTSAWFTALNNGVISALAAVFRSLICELSAIIFLPLLWGVDGIWLSVNAAEIAALLLSIVLILSFRKKYGY